MPLLGRHLWALETLAASTPSFCPRLLTCLSHQPTWEGNGWLSHGHLADGPLTRLNETFASKNIPNKACLLSKLPTLIATESVLFTTASAVC